MVAILLLRYKHLKLGIFIKAGKWIISCHDCILQRTDEYRILKPVFYSKLNVLKATNQGNKKEGREVMAIVVPLKLTVITPGNLNQSSI